jgi:hypothetical protein
MRVSHLQFTIRSLMLAVALVAGLLMLPPGWNVLVPILIFPLLSLRSAQWLVAREQRRVAAFSFGCLAILINVAYVSACTFPHYLVLLLLFLGWFVIGGPAIVASGAAWAMLATHENAQPRRIPHKVWLSIVALTVFPLATLCTLWPLRLAFVTARPSLEHFADQVAAGRTVGFPQRAGLFQLVGSRVDSSTGNVGLMTDADPAQPTGFVRIKPSTPPNRAGPFSGSNLLVALGWGWDYRQED